MNEKELKEYLKYKELGVKILTWVYLGLIIIIYLGMGFYINEIDASEENIYQSIVPLIITGVIGGFSKGMYFSLVDLIFDNEEALVTEKVKKGNRKVEAIVNFITIMLLLRFLVSMDTYENVFLTVSIIAISCLFLLLIIAAHFKFTPSSVKDIREKIEKKEDKEKKKERTRRYKDAKRAK